MAASLTSLFTPTSLFVVLNIVIGTVVVISRFGGPRTPQHHSGFDNPPQLVRAPSLLERVRSIDYSFFKFDRHETEYHNPAEPDYGNRYPDPVFHTQIERAPSLLERLKSMNFSSLYRAESSSNPEAEALPKESSEAEHPNPNQSQAPEQSRSEDHAVRRSKSESSGEEPASRVEKMTKSASEKSSPGSREFEEGEDSIERRRPLTSRTDIKRDRVGDDEEVDKKADDFINRFKQQLRLQRLDSLMRYRDMLRGK